MEFKRLKVWQITIFVVLWLSYGGTYLLRKPLGVIKNDLQFSFHLSDLHLGWVDTAFLLPYALVSLTCGHIGDQLGPRITMSAGLIIPAAASVLVYFCQSFIPILVLLTISGAGQALCWPATSYLLSQWYADKSRNSIFGMLGTCCFVGGLAGTGLAVYIQATYGWRAVFLLPAVIVALLGVLVFFIGCTPQECALDVPGRKADQQASVDEKSRESKTSFLSIWKIAVVPEISLAMFCMKAVRYALMMWLPLYLLRSLGYSQVNAGLASTAFEVGGAVGSALFGVIVDRCMGGNAILSSAISIGGSAVALIAFIVTASWDPIFHVLFLATAGALNCGPDILLGGSVAADIGERAGGTALSVSGVVNGMGSLGTVLEGPMVSAAVYCFGWSSMVPLMVLLSFIGAAAAVRGNTIHSRYYGMVKVSETDGIA